MKNYRAHVITQGILYLLLCSAPTYTTPELPCKKAYDSCWCATPAAPTQGVCVPSLSGKEIYCSCMVVETPEEVEQHQKKLFDNAADELFYNPGGPAIPMQERKNKGAKIKADLKRQLDAGTITYYSTKIPIGARLNTDYACSQAPNYSCDAFNKLLTDGKLGALYLTKDALLPTPIFNRYNRAITQICNEIQGGSFIQADIKVRKGWRSAPKKTIDLLTNPCLRFIDILERSGLQVPDHEKTAIMAICTNPEPQETMANNDPCVCGNQRQAQSLKPGLCQSNKHYPTEHLSCHCED